MRGMINIKFPKTPEQVQRETTAEIATHNVGLTLRVMWEVTKPILKWTVIIAILSFLWMLYLRWHLVFGTMKE